MPALARWVGVLLAFVVGDVFRIRRRHVVFAMRRAGVVAPVATASEMYQSLARGVMELLLARRHVGAVDIDDRARALLEKGGVVIATAHTGSFDLVACAAAERVPLSVVTKRLSIGFLDRIWQRRRAAHGVRLLHVGEAWRPALGALRRGEAVAMLVDQAPERARATILVPFLGATARVDLAPALLAQRARVPLALVVARRTRTGRHVAELLGVVEPTQAGAFAAIAMKRVTEWLDAFVRRHPEQWLWMHRRWKDVPAGGSDCRVPSEEICNIPEPAWHAES